MAKGQHLTPYQKRIVRNYYENRETLMLNRLSELVSDLFVCADKKTADRLWKRVETALNNLGVRKSTLRQMVDQRDLAAVARLLGERT